VLGFQALEVANLDAVHLRVAVLVPRDREQPHPLVVEGESVEHEGMVRRQDGLASAREDRMGEHGCELARRARVQRLIEVVDSEDLRRMIVQCEDEQEQDVEGALAGVVARELVALVGHVAVVEPHHLSRRRHAWGDEGTRWLGDVERLRPVDQRDRLVEQRLLLGLALSFEKHRDGLW
jgi:hypothetical protein